MAEIIGINGPIVTAQISNDNEGVHSFFVSEMMEVGPKRLMGEIIALESQKAIIQVFEQTTGLRPRMPIYGTGKPLSVCLRPGVIGQIFDGVMRPLINIEEKKWPTKVLAAPGQILKAGDIFAQTEETPAISFRSMVPPYINGEVEYSALSGEYAVDDTIIKLKTSEGAVSLTLSNNWPIRVPRPVSMRKSPFCPLITGQRVIDSLFPLSKGGVCAIPGGFGTGKTMTQHQLAKWCDADIIVYIGCGERGNEMTGVLEDFKSLVDPRTGQLLLKRTVLVANTSDMPVAAREASIYTGITIAEGYRDMGYHVAVVADSTSRWAEALRERAARLEEIPAEEGYPAYLASHLSSFYERAGYVRTLSGKEGSVTIVGAVSPQGGDFSEPITQNTQRFVRCFWALDRRLAYARHFPAIDWINSYSDYSQDMAKWYLESVGDKFLNLAESIRGILNEETKLEETAKLMGEDVLPGSKRLVLAIARVIRLGFLQQNALHEVDTYVPLDKQQLMMQTILALFDSCKKLLDLGADIDTLLKNEIFDEIIAMKYEIGNDEPEKFGDYLKRIYTAL